MQDKSFSRREVFRWSAVAGAAAMLPALQLRAQERNERTIDDVATTRPTNGAGFYRFKVGDIEATLVSDGAFVAKPSDLFFDTDKATLEAAAAKVFVSPNGFPAHINTVLLKGADGYTLIDTGAAGAFGPTTGKLAGTLKALGVATGDVKRVVLTHMHGDHIGGLTTAEGKPRFANARVVVAEPEHAFWSAESPDLSKTKLPEEMRGMLVTAAKKALAAAGANLDIVKPDADLGGGVSLVPAFGHTPGHVLVRVSSGDQTYVHVGDALHVVPIQVGHPAWHMLYDADVDAGAATRQKVLAMLAADKSLVSGAHFPFPGLGHVAPDGDAYRWVSAMWEW